MKARVIIIWWGLGSNDPWRRMWITGWEGDTLAMIAQEEGARASKAFMIAQEEGARASKAFMVVTLPSMEATRRPAGDCGERVGAPANV
eukprot:CAMPEP_0196666542 /NCGR_PEP_ID=MMETSP1086-20130531/64574_1 /TAXON_ID=77921 /ORGANISM="Cyanoptyche  gloeocystis , Strain SAG4.97" /LENGTH=88 /DNA_ID=CAMNT_0042003749 /DNA_START=428 /DNA_END=694 /DNA_ORIENTATION=-